MNETQLEDIDRKYKKALEENDFPMTLIRNQELYKGLFTIYQEKCDQIRALRKLEKTVENIRDLEDAQAELEELKVELGILSYQGRLSQNSVLDTFLGNVILDKDEALYFEPINKNQITDEIRIYTKLNRTGGNS
jgi:hypothetical protein